MTLDEAKANVGHLVIYQPRRAHLQPDAPGEPGFIKSANDYTVFVRYGLDSTSKATQPEDLTLATAVAS